MPSPDDVLDLYWDSLRAIGIEPAEHDVRLVEDDWESPTLGAWGLGWEVWLNGMEVTQFTYFQQVGGFECRPVPAEITYGLERLAMYIQGVDNVYDLVWVEGPDGETYTYGDVFLENERQYSKHNFELADTEMLYELFDTYEKECASLLEGGVVLPAYDYVLKCSHVFNLLDARGAIAVAERVSFIGRVRTLAKACAEAYVARVRGAADEADRARSRPSPRAVMLHEPHPRLRDRCRGDPLRHRCTRPSSQVSRDAEKMLGRCAAGLRVDPTCTARLGDSRSSSMSWTSGRKTGTCALAVRPSRLPSMRTATRPRPRKASPAARAWTSTALERVEDETGAYVYAVIDEKGEDAAAVLPTMLRDLVAVSTGPSPCGGGREILDSRVRCGGCWPSSAARSSSSSTPACPRTGSHGVTGSSLDNPISVPVADDYALAMERGRVVFDQEKRATFLREGIEAAAGSVDGTAVVPEKIFAEVVNLVE